MVIPPINIFASAPPANRGGAQADLTIRGQSIRMTASWGSAPGSAVVTYVGTNAPVTAGASLRLETGGHTFWGVCKLDTILDGTDGLTRVLEFLDNREFLGWDTVFGTFNQTDVRMVNGVRTKRYWHIYPADVLARRKTYTDAPLRARDILDALFGSATVYSPWVRIYHADQLLPVLNIDCLGGKTLTAVVQEVCDKQGLVFTLQGAAWRLVFARKGAGALPVFPANADMRRSGLALSGNHTRVVVLGDENLYQVMNVPLLPDWVAAWESFVVIEEFADDIYKRGSDPGTGVRFNATPGDPEQYQGRQLAMAQANVITVREYVALRNAVKLAGEPNNDGNRFLDHRKFAGRSRLDMPAALYLRTLLFRAFKPNLSTFVNAYGQNVPVGDAELVDRLLTRVSHNPATGVMSGFPAEPAEGNGYAVVKGYQVGNDLFRTLRPDQFKLDMFASTRAVWQHAPFQLDDSGEGSRFLIFDEPVVVSANLLIDVDGQKVINAAFTLLTPPAAATLTFRAEAFQYLHGTIGRDLVENVPGLHGEYVVNGAVVTEIPFADTDLVNDKAADIAVPLGNQQFYYAGGGYIVRGSNGTQLSPVIDRVEIQFGPQGVLESVDFTNERGHSAFQPERELDRAAQLDPLFPGQAELNQDATYAKLLASGFKQNPKFGKALTDYLNGTGMLNTDQPVERVHVGGPVFTNVAAGTPLRRKPMVPGAAGAANTDTRPILPGTVAGDFPLFGGVLVRHNEKTGDRAVLVQTTGVALARVRGPVEPNDSVKLPDGAAEDYLVTDGEGVAVGIAHGRITSNETKLIPVLLGSGGGSSPALDARWA